MTGDSRASDQLLQTIAQELWGEKYRIVRHKWADGDEDVFAEHLCGIVETNEDGQIAERERLFLSPDGDEYAIRRERYRKAKIIETSTERR